MYNKELLSSNNAKTIKGEKKNYKTFILYMSPFTQNSKGVNLCPMASEGCANSCLFESGFGGIYSSVKNGRIEKTEFYLSDRIGFLDKLVVEIGKLEKKVADSEFILAIRLNGTSDISFEKQKRPMVKQFLIRFLMFNSTITQRITHDSQRSYQRIII